MDYKTAEMLVLEAERRYLDDVQTEEEDLPTTLDDTDVQRVEFECVPLEVDNHALLLVPIEEVKELRI
jgi:hypothetical protein